MKGFFTKEQAQSPYRSEKGIHSCVSCGLYKSAETPRMSAYGNFKKGIMVIGEAPGKEEDSAGAPWQGKMGRVLQRKYKQLGIDLFDDCISLNAVNCRPVDKSGSNRSPNEYEIACCRQNVLAEIKRYKPPVIILHGGSALSSLIGYRWKKDLGGVTKWAGWTIPDRDFNAWVCPTFHPSYIERQDGEESEVEVWWTEDLKRAFTKVSEPLPSHPPEEDCITVTHDIESVLTKLNDEKPELMTFDIEATGLKPFNKKKHQIVAISFCYDENRAFAIPAPKKKKHIGYLKELLENPKIGKIAANMKYEDNWLVTMYNIRTRPWTFDTMLAAHILDNRPGITGLKFQSFVRFGVLGYDDEVAPYLRSTNSNSVNRIQELTANQSSYRRLLVYNGIDSLLEFRLAKIQMKEMELLQSQ